MNNAKQLKCFLCTILSIFMFAVFEVRASEKRVSIAISMVHPLVKHNEETGWSGPLVSLLDQVEKKVGIDFERRYVPFNRAIKMAKNGEVDFAVFMSNPKRHSFSMPIAKLYETRAVLISRQDQPIGALEQVTGKLIGHVRQSADIKVLKALKNINYYPYDNHMDGFHLLEKGRVDGLVTADFRIRDALINKHIDPAKLAPMLVLDQAEIWLHWSWKSMMDFKLVRKVKETIMNLYPDAGNQAFAAN